MLAWIIALRLEDHIFKKVVSKLIFWVYSDLLWERWRDLFGARNNGTGKTKREIEDSSVAKGQNLQFYMKHLKKQHILGSEKSGGGTPEMAGT